VYPDLTYAKNLPLRRAAMNFLFKIQEVAMIEELLA
jgi:hypothetical protein